jgi:hypothetical protein
MITSKSLGLGNSISTSGGEKTIFPDHLVEGEIEAAVYQPLPYEAGSTDVIMLDEQGAHLAQSSLGPND